VKLVPYPLIYDHGWQMDFPSLEKAVSARTRGVVVVHPNNPTGSYVQTSEFELLSEFCRTHKLALIVDEVFLDYRVESDHAGRPSFAGQHEVLTFTLSGLSKIAALPQMKVAWIVTSGPEEEVSQALGRLEVIADTYLSLNTPVQWALPTLLDQRSSIRKQLLGRIKRNLVELDRQLAEQKACHRLNLQGGWYAVVRVPVTRSDEELAIALVREQWVLVHPGHFYDFPSEGYLVLSLIAPIAEFSDAIGRVLALIGS
jgi:alanine-synthesizing transaminase